MKKMIIWLLVIVLAGSMSLGAAPAKETTATSITIGVSMVLFDSPYAGGMVKEFKKYTEEKGYKLIILDAKGDIQKEAENMDILMEKKVDVILLLAVDAEGSKAAAKKAVDAGFTVISINSPLANAKEIGLRAFTGPNSYLQAQTIAKKAIELDPNGNVVMITGTPGYAAAIERKEGFLDEIKTNAPNMHVLAIQTSNWMREEAQRVTSDFITKYGDSINIVYGADDNISVGAVNAFKAAGYTKKNRPYFVSITAMPDFMKLIKEGWADATILQSPKVDARLAVDTAIKILNGKQKEAYKEYIMKNVVVDKSNVQKIMDMGVWD